MNIILFANYGVRIILKAPNNLTFVNNSKDVLQDSTIRLQNLQVRGKKRKLEIRIKEHFDNNLGKNLF